MPPSSRNSPFPSYLPYTLLAALACASTIHAANITDTWNPALTTGNWSNAANWSAGLPGNNAGALYDIQIQSSSSQSILYDLPTSPTNLNSLTVDATGNATNTLSMSANTTLSILNLEIIANTGNATFIQTAGTNNVGALEIGYGSNSNGSYTLGDTTGDNPTLTALTGEAVGWSGNGTFSQYSGTNSAINLFLGNHASGTYNLADGNFTLSGGLFVGYNAAVSANFFQTGGNLSVNDTYGYTEYIGYQCNGNFTQTGGSHTVAADLYVGYGSSSGTSTYMLGQAASDSPVLNISGSLRIGCVSTGIVTQNAGSATAAGLVLYTGNSSHGHYNLNGGNLTLTTTPLYIDSDPANGSPTFVQTGGNLFVNAVDANAVSEYVGLNNGGNFTQPDGNNTLAHNLDIGQTYPYSQSTTYTLGTTTGTSPNLTVYGDEQIGVPAGSAFIQNSGNNTTSNLYLDHGLPNVYTLNAGNLTVTPGGLYFGIGGDKSPPTVNQYGGNITVMTGNEYISYGGPAIFSQINGTNTTANLYVGYGNVVGNFAIAGNGTYFFGNTAGANPTLNVAGTEYLGPLNSNSIFVFNNTGSFTQYSGSNSAGSLTLSSGSYTLLSGSLTLTAGPVSVGCTTNSSNFIQSGGNISANGADAGNVSEYVGYYGIGNFTQTAGNNTLSGNLVIGQAATYPGYAANNYTLGNATGATPNLLVMGTEQITYGAFVHYSGNNSAANLYLGWPYTSFNSSYTQYGGVLRITGDERIGTFGNATFSQVGGSNTAANLYVTYGNIIGNGAYVLGDTSGDSPSLTITGGEYIGYYTNLNAPANGCFTQYSGNNDAGSLSLGYASTAGNYSLLGGNLTLTGGPLYVGFGYYNNNFFQSAGNISANGADANNVSEYIGDAGVGNFTQTGGNNTVLHNLIVGQSNYSNHNSSTYTLGNTTGATPNLLVMGTEQIVFGTFVHYSGRNSAQNLYLGSGYSFSPNSYTQYGGILSVAGDERIGTFGNGTFSQVGGTNTATNLFVSFGDSASFGIGAYVLGDTSGASPSLLITGSENIGYSSNFNLTANGCFTQYSGDNNAGTLSLGYINSGGIYSIIGGNLTIAGTLKIYNQANTAFNLSGGSLSVSSLDFSKNPSLFHWTAGNLTIDNSVIFDPASSNTTSTAFGSSLSLSTNQSLQITGNETLGGASPFSLTLNNGSSNIVSGNITLPPTGTLNLNPGSSLSYSTLFQSGGSINGTLLNQSLFFYQAGNFTGTLINQANAVFTADTGSPTSSPLSIISTGHTNISVAQHLNSLSIQAGDTTLFGAATKTNNFSLGGSTNAWTGLLILASSGLIIEDSANHAPALAILQNQITYAQSNQAGITGAYITPNVSTIAVIDNAIANLSTFGGESLDANSILLAPAFIGDANLDGVVDIQDLTTVANNWQQSVTSWSQGDFDNNGIVDIQDLTAIANHWQDGLTSATSQSFNAALLAAFSQPTAPTPEPSSLALLFLSTLPFLHRKKPT